MHSVSRLLRLWFTFEDRVDRRTYFVHGALLMALKYVIDATVIWLAAGRVWTPVDYLTHGNNLQGNALGSTSSWKLVLFGLWTLPFLWIGITMTVRRALDAGLSAWLALLFFVPWGNYLFMLMLSVLRSEPRSRANVELPRASDRQLPSALLSIAAGSAIGLGMMWFSVRSLHSYGATLFLGAPFVMGAVTAFLFNRRYPARRRETLEVVVMTLAMVGGVMLLVAWEGVGCLAMAAPLAIGLGLLGAELGRWIAIRDPRSPANAMLAVLVLPVAAVLESDPPPRPLREVLSVVEIDAPTDVVWRHVVEFPALEAPTELMFRMGIAYPMSARIEGAGVGAVRYCVFSTGAFVEPITAWEPERILGFDVTDQPAPLTEWSPYATIDAPHLDGFFRARRGEFRLVPLPDGRTRLEGRTWYELEIFPGAYWLPMTDAIVRRIHHRVLMHIGRLAENGSTRPPDMIRENSYFVKRF